MPFSKRIEIECYRFYFNVSKGYPQLTGFFRNRFMIFLIINALPLITSHLHKAVFYLVLIFEFQINALLTSGDDVCGFNFK